MAAPRERRRGASCAQQDRILAAAWPLLAPGGKLLYVTCSVFADENEARVAAFAARTPDALRETLTLPVDARHDGGQLLPSLGGASHNQDGFFYARLAQGVTPCRTRRREPVRLAVAATAGRASLPHAAALLAPRRHRPRLRPCVRARLRARCDAARVAATARADVIPVRAADLRVEDGEVLASAQFDLALTPPLEEALQKGIPLYFTIELELTRPRWYWVDEKVRAVVDRPIACRTPS